MRPVAASGGPDGEALRDSLNTLFGGAFTSRLMKNIREKHGYSYGARSSLWREADQFLLGASSSVQTAVTGAALAEFRREFDAVASGNVTADELTKATRTVRFDLVSSAATASGLSDTLGEIIADGRPLDSVGREIAALDRVDLSGVNVMASSGLFDWSKLLVVLVGDKAAVLPQLRAAGFPEPALVSPEGAPM
jgi:predicted Zn-dependent peptidase